MNIRQPYTFDRVVRLVITVLLLLVAVWLINLLKGVLLPFCVAALIAYMFEPFVQHNRRLLHLRGRVTAIFVTLFEALFFFCAALYFLVPMIIDEMHSAAEIVKRYAAESATIAYLPETIHDFIKRYIDFDQLGDMLITQDWTALIESTLATSWSIITGSISVLLGVFSWCIVALYVVFIMIDYERLGRSLKHLVPPRYRREAIRLGKDIQRSMNHYFRGQALIATCVGVLFAIGFSIIGLPLAIVLGLFIGLLNMVPYLQLISIVPTTLLCLVYAAGGGGNFWSIFWECMAVYAIVQVIQDLILTPKIMGKAMGLNPAIILLSLSVWGTLLGFIGLIIALPLTTLCLSYYDRYVIRRDIDSGDAGDADADVRAIDAAERMP